MSTAAGTASAARRAAGRQLSAHPALFPASSPEAVDELLDAAVLVAEALANAHRAGEVHGAITAENIVVCGPGSVVLMGWPDAAAARNDEESDPRRDICALGAVLHIALLGRPYHPGAASAPAAGGCAPPPALLDIILRALGADPTLRYLSADSLAADLRSLREGRRSAARSSSLRPAARPRRRAVAGVLAVAVAAGVAAWTMLPPGGDGWRLAVEDRFDPATASTRSWRATLVPDYQRLEPVTFARSGWRIVDGVLIGQDAQGRISNLARTDLPAGALRAAWRITPEVSPLNLNCFVGGSNRLDGYTIHVAGWGRPDYVAVTRGAGAVLDSRTLERPLHAGTTYRFELSADRGRIAFAIDGREVLACEDPEPLGVAGQGGLGFEVGWNTIRIDDLRVDVRPYADDPLASAEAFAAAGAWARAALAYQSFTASHPGHAQVALARLRGAVALLRAGYAEEGMAAITELGSAADPAVARLARFERLRALAAGVEADALDGLVGRLAAASPDRTMARLALSACSMALAARAGDAGAEASIDQVRRLRGWAAALGVDAAEGVLDGWAERLNRLGRHAAAIELVPEATTQHALALLALARYAEVHERFPAMAWARYLAYSDTCGYAAGEAALREPFLLGRLLRESGVGAGDPRIISGFDRAFALTLASGPDAAAQQLPAEPVAVAFALLGAGRAEEALRVEAAPALARGLALLQLGRLDDAVQTLPAGAEALVEVPACRAIAALAAGDTASARALAVLPKSFAWDYRTRWSSHAYDPVFGHHFAAFVLPALVAWQADGSDPVPAWTVLAGEQTARCSQRVDQRWGGLLGRNDAAAILAQPFRAAGHPQREAALVTAIRADLAGAADAAGRWRDYLALASPFDVAARAWARLRLERLGR